MKGKHSIYATSKGTALEHFVELHPRLRGSTRRGAVEGALARGWLFYVSTPTGEPEAVRGASKVVSASMWGPAALWMQKPLD